MSQALSKMLNEYTFEEVKVENKLPFALQTNEIIESGVYMDW